jgi:hypothetical protein
MVFLATLIGIFDLAQILFIHQSLVERARMAARWGAVNAYDQTAIQNLVRYGQTTAPDDPSQTFLGLTAAMVAVSNPNAGTSEARVVVQIQNYPYRFFSPYIAGAFTGRPATASIPSELP